MLGVALLDDQLATDRRDVVQRVRRIVGQLRPSGCAASTADTYCRRCRTTFHRPPSQPYGALCPDCIADGDIVTLTTPPDARPTACERRMTAANAEARVRRAAPTRSEIRVQPGREAISVRPVGELDLPESRRLSTAIDELVEAGFEDIVIDLSGLEFIDCAGVRVLLAQHAAAVRDGRRLSLIQGRACIRRVFALTETLDMLPFERA